MYGALRRITTWIVMLFEIKFLQKSYPTVLPLLILCSFMYRNKQMSQYRWEYRDMKKNMGLLTHMHPFALCVASQS
jgi:hypothetical protein